jgi:hypothetical protein
MLFSLPMVSKASSNKCYQTHHTLPQKIHFVAHAIGSDILQACYRRAQTFKHPNIQTFMSLSSNLIST